MVSEVTVIRESTEISENPAVYNSYFAAVGVESICVRKWRGICWLHIYCHCYGLQKSKNVILYIDPDVSYFMMGCMAFMSTKVN